jgi:hypothetical protein
MDVIEYLDRNRLDFVCVRAAGSDEPLGCINRDDLLDARVSTRQAKQVRRRVLGIRRSGRRANRSEGPVTDRAAAAPTGSENETELGEHERRWPR